MAKIWNELFLIKSNLGSHATTILSTFKIWELLIMPTLVMVIATILKNTCMVISIMRGLERRLQLIFALYSFKL